MSMKPIVVAGVVVFAAITASPPLIAQPGTKSTSPVIRIEPGPQFGTQVVGAFSTLVRTADAIRMHVSTSDLEPGAAYTVWWVIFNNPEFCEDGCGLDDIQNPTRRALTQVAVGYAAGHVVSQSGKANFSARLRVGDLSGFGGGLDSAPPPPLGPGLLDPLGAEVHLVIRTHGQKIPGLVDEQIHSFEGGCTIAPLPRCVDVQASIHLPS
jgi:hypothetical protein